jgi:hypothetical protein
LCWQKVIGTPGSVIAADRRGGQTKQQRQRACVLHGEGLSLERRETLRTGSRSSGAPWQPSIETKGVIGTR